MALVIAGERSGVGKTTVTLALLSCLKRRNLSVQSFKVGPDYIDPMFHHYVTGRACRNLDPVLTSESYVRESFSRHIQGVEFALVEGVMGLFDGVTLNNRRDAIPTGLVKGDWLEKDKGTRKQGDNGGFSQSPITSPHSPVTFASTAHIARLLDLPVLLVIDCSRLSGSVAAIAHGYCSFDPTIKIAGLILNRVGSDRHLELLKDALEPLNLPILGVLRRQDSITIPDRHLGLVPTAELPQMEDLIDKLAHLGEACFDWQQLLPLLECQKEGRGTRERERGEFPVTSHQSPITIAIARDRAFNFYYQDNLDLLEQLGAELVFWSPLSDTALPEKVQGLYFGGGFPEVFAEELSNNYSIRQAVKNAILSGIPTYAECGGLMYLCEEIVDFEKQSWPMVGILPTKAEMGSRLTLGYRQATAFRDSPILPAGATVWGHEFHRSSLSQPPPNPLFQIKGFSHNSANEEGWNLHNVHASYVHLHFGDRPEIPSRFLEYCEKFYLKPRSTQVNADIFL